MSKVAELRKRAGLTQRELADLTGVTEPTIRNLENNRNGVDRLAFVAKLCEVLDCSVQELIEYKSVGETDDY